MHLDWNELLLQYRLWDIGLFFRYIYGVLMAPLHKQIAHDSLVLSFRKQKRSLSQRDGRSLLLSLGSSDRCLSVIFDRLLKDGISISRFWSICEVLSRRKTLDGLESSTKGSYALQKREAILIWSGAAAHFLTSFAARVGYEWNSGVSSQINWVGVITTATLTSTFSSTFFSDSSYGEDNI